MNTLQPAASQLGRPVVVGFGQHARVVAGVGDYVAVVLRPDLARVLVLYASTLTEPGIVLVVALASAAFLWALLALVIRAHSPLAWLALGTSLVFPIVVWEWLQSLQGASSAKCRLAALR